MAKVVVKGDKAALPRVVVKADKAAGTVPAVPNSLISMN